MRLILFLKNIFLGRMDASFYKENCEELRSTNYNLLRTACLFSTGMCFFLFCLTLISEIISELSRFYFIYLLFFACLTALVLTVVKKKRQLICPAFYLFATAIFALVIDVGTRYTPQLPAVTFYVFLMIIPILFVTRPIYSVLLSIGACAVFCIVTIQVKGAGSYLASTDVLNAICCCMVGVGLDTTIVNLQLENIEVKTHFKRQSATDELTGLPNRRSFDSYIEKLFEGCPGNSCDIYVFMMDIDDFKAYNDTYGHLQGDECLRRVSQALQQQAEAYGVFLSRFGGEEFVAVSTGCDHEEAGEIARQFVECIERMDISHTKSSSGRITISAGYAGLKDMEDKDYRKLVDCADAALYIAKAKGKNQAQAWKNEK